MASRSSLEWPSNLWKQENWPSMSIVQWRLANRFPYAHSWWGQKALDRDVLQLSQPHCICQMTWPHSWKADLDRAPFRQPTRRRHSPSPQLPSLNTKKKGSKSRQITLFLGINTNSLTPTGSSRHLILETHFQLSSWHSFYYSLYYSLQLTTFTLIHSQSLLCHYWLCHQSPFAKYHTSTTPFFSHHVVPKHIFFRKYQKHHYSTKRFLGFSSRLERVMHSLVVERNLTLIDWR